MKDEKMDMCNCNCCMHGGMGGMWGGKHLLMTVGTLAFVYGLVTYLMVAYAWPTYAGWMVGGALLVLIGWLKKWMWMMQMGKGT